MPKIEPHAWESAADSPEVVEILKKAKRRLSSAWERDRRYPKSFPVHTAAALDSIQAWVQRKAPQRPWEVPIASSKLPTTLAELIPEVVVKSIWELRHSGNFKAAIQEAARFDPDHSDRSPRFFKGILWAIERAYWVHMWGDDLLPTPKVNILHHRLGEIAKASGFGDQTGAGFAQFLDDFCPCGIKSHREAVRKMRSRIQTRSREKVGRQ